MGGRAGGQADRVAFLRNGNGYPVDKFGVSPKRGARGSPRRVTLTLGGVTAALSVTLLATAALAGCAGDVSDQGPPAPAVQQTRSPQASTPEASPPDALTPEQWWASAIAPYLDRLEGNAENFDEAEEATTAMYASAMGLAHIAGQLHDTLAEMVVDEGEPTGELAAAVDSLVEATDRAERAGAKAEQACAGYEDPVPTDECSEAFEQAREALNGLMTEVDTWSDMPS